MDNIYEMLMGAAPTKSDQMKAIADTLRQNRDLGMLGQLTGDRVLSPLGAGMMKQADATPLQFQNTRQHDVDNAQTKDYQDWQKKQAADSLSETRRWHDLESEYQNRMADAANARATGVDNKSQNSEVRWLSAKMNSSGLDELQQAVSNFNLTVSKYKDPKTGNIPGVGGLSNFPGVAAATGGEGGKQVRSSLASVRNAILKARSGGAVTDGEAKRALEELGQSVLYGQDDTMRAIDGIKTLIGAKVASLEAGVSPESLQEYRKRYSTAKGSTGTWEDVGSPTPAQGKKRFKVDAEGNVIGN